MTGFRSGVTVKVRQGFTVDNYGGRTGPDEEFDLRGVGLQPGGSGTGASSTTEPATGRDADMSDYLLITRDPAVPIRVDAEIELPAPYGQPGEVFEVIGAPRPYINPISGRSHGAIVPLRRVEG